MEWSLRIKSIKMGTGQVKYIIIMFKHGIEYLHLHHLYIHVCAFHRTYLTTVNSRVKRTQKSIKEWRNEEVCGLVSNQK